MAKPQITVHRGRRAILPVSLRYDVSNDVLTSQIRADKNKSSELIATWTITFETDGTDGELLLVLDDEITAGITKTVGYMDMKRVSDGEPLDVFAEPVEVIFRDPITA